MLSYTPVVRELSYNRQPYPNRNPDPNPNPMPIPYHISYTIRL